MQPEMARSESGRSLEADGIPNGYDVIMGGHKTADHPMSCKTFMDHFSALTDSRHVDRHARFTSLELAFIPDQFRCHTGSIGIPYAFHIERIRNLCQAAARAAKRSA